MVRVPRLPGAEKLTHAHSFSALTAIFSNFRAIHTLNAALLQEVGAKKTRKHGKGTLLVGKERHACFKTYRKAVLLVK